MGRLLMREDERVRMTLVLALEADTTVSGICDEADDKANLLVMAKLSLPEEERISCPLNLELLELNVSK